MEQHRMITIRSLCRYCGSNDTATGGTSISHRVAISFVVIGTQNTAVRALRLQREEIRCTGMPQGARPKASRQQARRRAQPYATKTRTRVRKGAGVRGGRKNFNDVKGKLIKVRLRDAYGAIRFLLSLLVSHTINHSRICVPLRTTNRTT